MNGDVQLRRYLSFSGDAPDVCRRTCPPPARRRCFSPVRRPRCG
ncbi:MAG: hypothetical protein BLITH_0363 [Brockia lithotrophica]|uniref:Uncharacterized protein n=1 Tax=Brockia lithotrophica TaxID=933949 RepID=A0A2T5GAS1_9BACL|nr:MAG: hypothetical protein BLITH_0363 [Brockia lithotrophica]